MNNQPNIKPLEDRVLVKPTTEEDFGSKILVPKSAKEKPQRGTVVEVGPGKKDEKMTLQKGDQVLYGKYAGTEITIEGEDYLLMRQSDVYALFTA